MHLSLTETRKLLHDYEKPECDLPQNELNACSRYSGVYCVFYLKKKYDGIKILYQEWQQSIRMLANYLTDYYCTWTLEKHYWSDDYQRAIATSSTNQRRGCSQKSNANSKNSQEKYSNVWHKIRLGGPRDRHSHHLFIISIALFRLWTFAGNWRSQTCLWMGKKQIISRYFQIIINRRWDYKLDGAYWEGASEALLLPLK